MVKLGNGGNFVKGDDVKVGDKVTFKNEGEWQENQRYKYSDGNPRWDFICQVDHNGEEKNMRINATNKKILISAWGNETADWVGKSAKMSVETVLVAGERRKTIVLEPEGADVKAPEDIAWDE